MLNIILSYVAVTSVLIVRGIYGDCLGPELKLLSDDPRRTCIEKVASPERIEYKCSSLIKGFPKAMIKYCPVELCMKNGTWSKPSISLSECYQEGKSMDYVGHRMCTSSGRHCQRWDALEPHKHKFGKSEMFPDYSIQLAEAYCRDPGGTQGAPWCFTTDPNKKMEFCDIMKCSEIKQMDGSCGPVQQEKDKQTLDDDEVENAADSSANEKNLSEKSTDDKIGFDDTDPLKRCPSEHEIFKMQKDYRIRGKVVQETHERSTLECATFCSRKNICRAFTFRPGNGACILHGGKEYIAVKKRGYTAGVKTCNL
ncbi:plasminogen-like isoform X2 [Mercenaria mercenaria]|uniref:plasminogen-like isoform X2 n=1 Tax=Mercenaria mercenaria TaxID=6596 RepID=UPI00234F91B4|nr:plasminogen-like isoform X2 [Mercenaria mercenaria]